MSQFFAILHNIRSCYNVGAIFRTAEALKIDKIFLTGYTPDPESNLEKIRKTALGAEKLVKWEKIKRINRLLEKLKKEKISIIALETVPWATSYFSFTPKFPLALLVGNEIRGLNKKILKKADFIIKIPMFGKKESLNVAVAFAIVAYHLKLSANL